jgi:hypothetical protein
MKKIFVAIDKTQSVMLLLFKCEDIENRMKLKDGSAI